jgi:hypothetical protein
MILYFLFAAFYLYRYIRNRVGYLCSNDFVYDTQLNGSLLICKGVNPPSTSSSVGSVHHCTHRGHHVECGLYCRQQDRTAAVLPFPSHGYHRSNFAGEFVAVNLCVHSLCNLMTARLYLLYLGTDFPSDCESHVVGHCGSRLRNRAPQADGYRVDRHGHHDGAVLYCCEHFQDF